MRLVRLFVAFVVLVVFGWSSGAGAVPLNNPIITGLVAAYEFTGNANDVSGNGNDGVVHGATLTADRFGNVGSAYSFDGVDDYIHSSTTFSPQASGTISLWFNQESNPASFGSTTFTSSRSDNGYLDGDFMFGHNPVSNEPGACYWGDAGNWFCAEGHTIDELTFPLTSDWHSVVWTWDTPSGSSFYINNELVDTAGITSPIFGNLDLEIGRSGHIHFGTPNYVFNLGLIDDLYIYDRALSPTEIQTLYSAVPEPSTALLLGIGLAGMAAASRRER